MAIDGIREEINRLLAVCSHLDRERVALLTDVRDAPMRNDPAFETQLSSLRTSLRLGFKHTAILVKTAVGRLQLKRLNEDSHIDSAVFIDEGEAIAHLRQIVGRSTPPTRR